MELERAIAIAAEAHAGQTDKAGQPYILHPLRVMLGAKTHDERVVAVLHDVVEDSDWTIQELMGEGLTEVQAAAIDSVTHREEECYTDYVERAGKNEIGRAVKILDLHNNCDLARIGAKKHDKIRKYKAALATLSAE